MRICFGVCVVLMLAVTTLPAVAKDVEPVPAETAQASHDLLVEQTHVDWGSFGLLTGLALMQGCIYAALLSFLPRFLGSWQVWGSELTQATRGSYLTAGVLVTGCLGQRLQRFGKGGLRRLRVLRGGVSQEAGLVATELPTQLPGRLATAGAETRCERITRSVARPVDGARRGTSVQ